MQKPRSSLRKDVAISTFLVIVAFSTPGLKWVPIANVGGITLEISSFGALVLCIGLLVLTFIRTGRVYAPAILVVSIALVLFVGMSFAIRGQTAGINTALLAAAYTVAAIAVANSNPTCVEKLNSSVFWACLVIGVVIAASAAISSVNIYRGVFEWIVTLDRNAFVYQYFRPLINAFAPAETVDYRASIINALSAGLTLLFIISAAKATAGSLAMLAIAFCCFCAVFVLGSSSALITCLPAGFLIGLAWLIRTRNFAAKFAVTGTVLAIAIALTGPFLLDFFGTIISDDVESRSARITQYSQAFHLIGENVILGKGWHEIDGNPIHNQLLFSWVSAGLLGFLLSFTLYVMSFVLMIKGAYGAFLRSRYLPEYLMLATLPMLFVVRISVGGAGGLPSGAGVYAIAVAVVVERYLRMKGETTRIGSLRRAY